MRGGPEGTTRWIGVPAGRAMLIETEEDWRRIRRCMSTPGWCIPLICHHWQGAFTGFKAHVYAARDLPYVEVRSWFDVYPPSDTLKFFAALDGLLDDYDRAVRVWPQDRVREWCEIRLQQHRRRVAWVGVHQRFHLDAIPRLLGQQATN